MDGGRDTHICDDPAGAARAAALRWEEVAREAVQARGAFHVALAGGSTPRTLYALLATPAWRKRFDWGSTWVWFGDERCVPPDHPDSNYRMALETLLSPLEIPASRVQRIETERGPEAAAADYDARLRSLLPRGEHRDDPPRFDLVLLGLGDDGHVASLFPDTPILDEHAALAAAVFVPKLDAWRVSLTFPVIDAARHVALLVAGAGKAEIVARVHAGRAEATPVRRLRPRGRLEWFLDREAARGLPPGAGAREGGA